MTTHRPGDGAPIVAAILLLTGCAADLSPDHGSVATGPVVVAGCSREAERLRAPLRVFRAPYARGSTSVVLPPDHYVYRCRRNGPWLGVMFPEAGSRIDCTRRPDNRPCPTGWTDEEPSTERYG